MRHDEDAEEDRSYEHSRCENPQMAHSRRLQRYKGQESSDGSDISHHERGEHFIERLSYGGGITLVHEEVQGVVNRYSDEDTAYSEDDGTYCRCEEA